MEDAFIPAVLKRGRRKEDRNEKKSKNKKGDHERRDEIVMMITWMGRQMQILPVILCR